MQSVAQPQEAIGVVPFYEDSRSLSERLAAEEREWRPHQPQHGCPAEIYGLVLELGEYVSSYRDSSGDNTSHTTARVLTEDNVVWSIVAFHGFLQSEFDRKEPRVGDFVALAYKGTKPAKKQGESDANDYRMEVERNSAGPSLVEVNDRGSEELVGSNPRPPISVDAELLNEDDDEIPF